MKEDNKHLPRFFYDVEKGDSFFTDDEVAVIERIERIMQEDKVSFTYIIQNIEQYDEAIQAFVTDIFKHPEKRIELINRISYV